MHGKRGTWNDESCGDTRRVVCKKCPAGWSQFGGECYKYFDKSVKWEDAREHCLSEEVVILMDRLLYLISMLINKLILLYVVKKLLQWRYVLVVKDKSPPSLCFEKTI